MKAGGERLEFENAAELRDRIRELQSRNWLCVIRRSTPA